MATLIITFILFCSNICSLIKYSVDTVSSSPPLPALSSSPRDSHFSRTTDVGTGVAAAPLARHETFLNRATPAKTTAAASSSLLSGSRVELVETKWSQRNVTTAATAASKVTETTPLIDPHV
jgi:hypothetical protein